METDRSFDSVLSRAETAMDFLALRHQAVASNLANANTPGYQTVDAVFESELKEQLESWRMIRTSPRHLEGVVPAAGPQLKRVPGLRPGPDGNNVQVEQELLYMTTNTLRFRIALQWAGRRLHALRSAVESGRLA